MVDHSARKTREAIISGQTTAYEVALSALHDIHSRDPELHSFTTVCDEFALATAAHLDQVASTREVTDTGPLWGVPFSVKDTYNTAGIRTTFGSRVYADHVPTTSAVLVDRVIAAGGVMIGKTNTPEFAIYPRTCNDLQPETVNPWDRTRTSGGSSGGAAASVAAGLTAIAVGSDGGGSIRIPSALCGVVGLMPSRGSIPRGGGLIGTRRFSSAGPIARHAEDARALWRVMQGPHPSDPISREFARAAPGVPDDAKEVSLRWIGESGVDVDERDVISTIRGAVNALDALDGYRVEDTALSLQSPQFSAPFYDIMMSDRLSTGGADLLLDKRKNALLTTYGRHQFERASAVTGADYSHATEIGLAAIDHLDALFGAAEFIITPTVGFVAPEIPPDTGLALPEDARRGLVAYTYLMNYTGYPAITVPCGLVRGLPVAMQVIGRPHSEERLFDVASTVQNSVITMPEPPILQRDDQMPARGLAQ